MLFAAIFASVALGVGPESILKPIDAGLYAPCSIVPVAELRRREWSEPFRAVALDLPRVWAVQRDGGVCLFEIDTQKRHQLCYCGPSTPTGAEGVGVARVGRDLYLPRFGSLARFGIAEDNSLTPSGMFGGTGKSRTAAFLTRGTVAFTFDKERIASFTGVEVGQTPNAACTLSTSEVWIDGDFKDGFLYAIFQRREDQATGLVVFEVGPDGSLTRRGTLQLSDCAMGVHALGDGRIALLSDVLTDRLTLVNVADPDSPVVDRTYAVPTSRCSVLAKFNGNDMLVTGRACLLFERNNVSSLPYPLGAGSMADAASYMGAAEGRFCAMATDTAIFITAFDEPIFRK